MNVVYAQCPCGHTETMTDPETVANMHKQIKPDYRCVACGQSIGITYQNGYDTNVNALDGARTNKDDI